LYSQLIWLVYIADLILTDSESKDNDYAATIVGAVTGTIVIIIGVVVLAIGGVLFCQYTKCLAKCKNMILVFLSLKHYDVYLQV